MAERKRFVSKMLSSEEQAKDYLLKKLLRDKGYNPYYQELKDYDLNIKKKTPHGAPGLIDIKNKVIIIREDFYNNSTDAEKSLLIRHELLHSMLNHVKFAIRWYAKKLYLDPDHLSKKEYKKVLKAMGFLMASFNEFSYPVLHNLAGDLHLSNYYDPEDENIVQTSELLRGLALCDHPQWRGLSYGDLMDAINDENNLLMDRLEDKVYAHTDETGKVIIDREEESEFKTATEINKKDLVDIVMPKVSDADQILAAFNTAGLSWSGVMALNYSEKDTNGKTVPVLKSYGLRNAPCNLEEVSIYPVFKGKYLYYYKRLQDNDTIMCCDVPCIALDNTHLISTVPIGRCIPEQDDYTENYNSSEIKNVFEDWKRKYK